MRSKELLTAAGLAAVLMAATACGPKTTTASGTTSPPPATASGPAAAAGPASTSACGATAGRGRRAAGRQRVLAHVVRPGIRHQSGDLRGGNASARGGRLRHLHVRQHRDARGPGSTSSG